MCLLACFFRSLFRRETVVKNTTSCGPLPLGLCAATFDRATRRYLEDEAHPEVHHQPEVNPKRLVTARQRQVWHQDEEVEQAAHNHGNKLFEKSSKHALVGHPQSRI